MSADRSQQVEEARRWLRVVDRDLGAARLCLEGAPAEPEAAAYHCQQAAEKIVKGLLVAACRDIRVITTAHPGPGHGRARPGHPE